MAGKTTIEWTHMPGYVGGVWNPTTGCARVSAGCDHCYAFALHDKRLASNLAMAKEAGAHRMNAIAQLTKPETIIARARTLGVKLPFPKQYDLPFSRVQLLEDRLDVPLHTKKPTCYFVDSMADLFHEDVPDEFIEQVWSVMVGSPRHRFLILTKRPERMRGWTERYSMIAEAENVWLGTSVEDQRAADERIPYLLATPAAVRFLSCEPLIAPIDLTTAIGWRAAMGVLADDYDGGYRNLGRSGLHWVIVGGESGPRARPLNLAWARSLVQQCRGAGVAVFVKQLGSNPIERIDTLKPGYAFGSGDLLPIMQRPRSELQERGWTRITTATETHFSRGVQLRESHGRDVSEWPEDLRIREWPRG